MDINDYEVLDTSPTFNYKIGEWVWFMQDNVPTSGRIWRRDLSERYKPKFLSAGDCRFESMSESHVSILYFINEIGMQMTEEKIFSCRQGLLMSL